MRQIYIILIYGSNTLMHHFSELIQLYINQLSSVDLAARLLPIIFHPHPFERRRLKTKGENAGQRSTNAYRKKISVGLAFGYTSIIVGIAIKDIGSIMGDMSAAYCSGISKSAVY